MTMQHIEYIFSIKTRDVPGMLVRITQVFARRGCNIASLNVHPSSFDNWRIIDIAAYDVNRPEQIEKHLQKLVDVQSVTTRKLVVMEANED